LLRVLRSCFSDPDRLQGTSIGHEITSEREG
jgi:hypothetical protein